MKYCKQCGKEFRELQSFVRCPFCGEKLEVQEDGIDNLDVSQLGKNTRKKRKWAVMAVAGGCILVVLLLITKWISVYDANKPENRRQRAVDEFVSYINKGEYEKAEDKLEYLDNVTGSFSEFAQEMLKKCTVKKNGPDYQLISGDNSFKLKYNSDTDTFSADDFLMKYKVKYTSYMTSNYNTFDGCKGEKGNDGLTTYTVKTFKTKIIKVDFSTILGKSDSVTGVMQLKANTDKDYKISSIAEISRPNVEEDETYDDMAYVDAEGIIVIDKYYIWEDYAGEMAHKLAGCYTDMTSSAIWEEQDFDVFYNRYNSYIFDSEMLREQYEKFVDGSEKIASCMDRIDCSATSWTYPQTFSYSDGYYDIKDTVSLKAYVGEQEGADEVNTLYGRFKPGENDFKLYSYSEEDESGLE